MRYLVFLILCYSAAVHGAINSEKAAVDAVTLEAPTIKDPKLIIDYQLSSLDRLIIMANRTIDNLNSLRTLIEEYKQKQEVYIEQPSNKEKLYKLAQAASQVLMESKKNSLLDALDPEFLNEITMLAQIYRKISLPSVN